MSEILRSLPSMFLVVQEKKFSGFVQKVILIKAKSQIEATARVALFVRVKKFYRASTTLLLVFLNLRWNGTIRGMLHSLPRMCLLALTVNCSGFVQKVILTSEK